MAIEQSHTNFINASKQVLHNAVFLQLTKPKKFDKNDKLISLTCILLFTNYCHVATTFEPKIFHPSTKAKWVLKVKPVTRDLAIICEGRGTSWC